MKLTDLPQTPSLKKLNQVTESRFGFKLDYESITLPKANAMRDKILETVTRIRKSSAIHTAEKNPKYLEMLIVYEGLSRWIDAHKVQRLNEDEVGTAAAILAAKDMVDTTQDMIEKVGKMQNEQLPALLDSIRDQIGSEQADAFKNTVGQVLMTLSQQVSQAREQLDASARALTGEDTAVAQDPAAMGMDPNAMPQDPNAMNPADQDLSGSDADIGGDAPLGRDRR